MFFGKKKRFAKFPNRHHRHAPLHNASLIAQKKKSVLNNDDNAEKIVVVNPFVQVVYSDSAHPQLQCGAVIPFAEANYIFEQRDAFCQAADIVEETYLEVCYEANGEHCVRVEHQVLGDGTGGLINRMKVTLESSLGLFEAGATANSAPAVVCVAQIIRSSREKMNNQVLPQLEEYCRAYKPRDDRL